MSERAPYSRVYWTIRADERLAHVYPSDANLAAWLRLLIAADMAWPAPADLPKTAKQSSVSALAEAGVIEILPGGLFRFHGLDAERGRRKDAAASSASARWQSERNANASQPDPSRNASRAETSRDEKSRAETPRASTSFMPESEDRDALDTYHELTGYRPWGEFSGDALKGAIKDYGNQSVDIALRAEYLKDRDRNTLLKRTQARLARDADRTRAATPPRRPAPVVDEKARREMAAKLAGRGTE